MSNAYKYRMPAGIAGDVTRAQHSIVESGVINSSKPPLAYGVAMKIVSGNVEPLESGDEATAIYGFLVRPYVTNNVAGAGAALGAGVPATSGVADILRRGYMAVKLAQGTAAFGAPVYVRITADTGKLVGDLETAADSAKCVLTGAIFMGPADADGIVEISYRV